MLNLVVHIVTTGLQSLKHTHTPHSAQAVYLCFRHYSGQNNDSFPVQREEGAKMLYITWSNFVSLHQISHLSNSYQHTVNQTDKLAKRANIRRTAVSDMEEPRCFGASAEYLRFVFLTRSQI